MLLREVVDLVRCCLRRGVALEMLLKAVVDIERCCLGRLLI